MPSGVQLAARATRQQARRNLRYRLTGVCRRTAWARFPFRSRGRAPMLVGRMARPLGSVPAAAETQSR